jgi:hypothetical protein
VREGERERENFIRNRNSPALFVNYRVKCHEDVLRNIWGLFQALGIQYRWILTRCDLARQLVTTSDLAIDYAKETTWMALHEHERDLLEDTMYRRLAALWSEFSDAITVFDAHTASQQLYAQNVWESLLDVFPLKHKHMQTVLLEREMDRMMKWDGDSKQAVNIHFGKVNETRQSLGYLDALTIHDVLKSVLRATLKASVTEAFEMRITTSWTTLTTTRSSRLRSCNKHVRCQHWRGNPYPCLHSSDSAADQHKLRGEAQGGVFSQKLYLLGERNADE